MRFAHVLPLLVLSYASAQQVPSPALDFQHISPPRVAKAAEAALLLTPEQVTQLNAEWRKTDAIVTSIQSRGANITAQDLEARKVALRSFNDFKESTLNEQQQEINALIVDIVSNIKKDLQMEYGQKFDTATGDERAAYQKQFRADLENQLIEGIKAALPPDRQPAFEAALGK